MSTLIKIDRNSIKKNKNAGSCQSHILGAIETTFKTICSLDEYSELLNDKNVYINTFSNHIDFGINLTGGIINNDIHHKLPGKYEIESNNNIETVNHFPIPKYSFQYENTPIECSECKNLIPRDEIEQDSYYTEDDDIDYEICPICKAHDSFEYEFESIDDALKPVL